jgi:hypothetical protein
MCLYNIILRGALITLRAIKKEQDKFEGLDAITHSLLFCGYEVIMV